MIAFESKLYGSVERVTQLIDLFEDFHSVLDSDIETMRFRLIPSERTQADDTPTVIFQPKTEKVDSEIPFGNTIRIRTTSSKKWVISAGATMLEDFTPIQDVPTENEENFHAFIRKQNKEFPKWYPVKVAAAKQSSDTYKTPLLTLDTVTYADDAPLEKPRDDVEARRMISAISGKQVTTETGWVLGMRLQSGASIQLLNSTSISYTMRSQSAEEVRRYVEETPEVRRVSGGLDLSISTVRTSRIDLSHPITFRMHNSFGRTKNLSLPAEDLYLSLFNPIFSGVPVFAIRALLPKVYQIYLHGDPIDDESPV